MLPVAVTSGEKEEDAAEKEKEKEEKPLELKSLNLKVTKGAFVTIIGRIVSGKVRVISSERYHTILTHTITQSSVLQALIGEMRSTRSEVCLPAFAQ